jgi:hypothetical protein
VKHTYSAAWLTFAILTFVSGCRTPAQTVLKGSNPSIKVELLFEVDGCKVYRFYDGGAPRYFTKCKDGNSSVGWIQSCGKNCSFYTENVTSYSKGGSL